jgi:hypothetical protein
MAKKPPAVTEKKWFVEDPEPLETAQDKNDQLSQLLTGIWNDLEILFIRRIEIGTPGWESTYRTQ